MIDMMDKDTKTPITLRDLREAAGYSQSKLGSRMGVSQSAVQCWEMGSREPTISNVAALARAFDVSFKTICEALCVDVSGIPDDGEREGTLVPALTSLKLSGSIDISIDAKSQKITVTGLTRVLEPINPKLKS